MISDPLKCNVMYGTEAPSGHSCWLPRQWSELSANKLSPLQAQSWSILSTALMSPDLVRPLLRIKLCSSDHYWLWWPDYCLYPGPGVIMWPQHKVWSSLAVTSGDVWGLGAAPLISPRVHGKWHSGDHWPVQAITTSETQTIHLIVRLLIGQWGTILASDWSDVTDVTTMSHHSMSRGAHIILN